MDAILIATYVLVSTAAIAVIKQYAAPAIESLKQGVFWTSPSALLAVGGFLYAISFLVWMAVLSRNELSVVYPVVIGLTLVSTSLTAWLLFGEAVTFWRLSGIAVIFAGIILITRN